MGIGVYPLKPNNQQQNLSMSMKVRQDAAQQQEQLVVKTAPQTNLLVTKK